MGARPTRTVFLWHPGSLGDVLLARPAMQALRAAYPSHEVLLAVRGEIGGLLRDGGDVDGLVSIEDQGLTALCAGSDRVRGAVGGALARCDVAVCWLADHDGQVRRALESLGIARVIVRSPHDAGVRAVHQTERFLETLALPEAGRRSGEPWRLPVLLAEEGRRRLGSVCPADGGPRVVVHPGSGSPHKSCAPALLAELVTRWREGGVSPVLLIGPADGTASARVQDLLPVPVPSCRDLDLPAAAGLLAAADLYLGHDSGITHLAAALGAPTIALFGPTSTARWAPRGDAVVTLSGSPCHCDGWTEIRACIEKPCLAIPVESVLEACQHLLARRRPRELGPSRLP